MRPRLRGAGGGATWLAGFLLFGWLVPTPARPEPVEFAKRAAWVEDDCTACHEIFPDFSHPIGMEPSMPVPPELPLEYGRVTCATCHSEAHLRTASVFDEDDDRGLRSVVPAGRQLCIQCHTGRRPNLGNMHMESSRRAHLRWPDRALRAVRLGPAAGEAQPSTRSCLSCHDGIIATNGATTSLSGGLKSGGHPVDVRYRVGRGRVGRNLVPIGALDPRIQLPDGRVGCESCHSTYSTRDDLLVMSNVGSQLCLSCHGL